MKTHCISRGRRRLLPAVLVLLLAALLALLTFSTVLADDPVDPTAAQGPPPAPGQAQREAGPESSTRVLTPNNGAIIRVLAFDGTRARDELVLGTGISATILNSALANPANFGPQGVVPCGIQVTYVPSIGTGALVSGGTRLYDVFYSPQINSWTSPLLADEAAELAAFLNAGGIVAISGESDNGGLRWNSLFTALGISDQYSGDNWSSGTAAPLLTTPSMAGPFGTVGPINYTRYNHIVTSSLQQVVTTGGGAYTLLAEGGSGTGYLSAAGDPLQHNFNTANYENVRYYLNLFALGCSAVPRVDTTTTLTSSLNPSVYGESFTLNAEVTATTGEPTGSVTFSTDGGTTVLCANVALSGGQASCGPFTWDVGEYPINATYNLDSAFNTSNDVLTQEVDKAPLTVTAVDQSKTYGESDPAFTFTYDGFITGEDASVLDTPPTCTVAVPHDNAGTYPITCSGGADNSYSFDYVNGTLTVERMSTTTTLTTSENSTLYGQPFTFNATVDIAPFDEKAPVKKMNGVAPPGSVTFSTDGGTTVLCANVPLSGGQASCGPFTWDVGQYPISAAYNPDANSFGSNDELTQKVKKATLTVTAKNKSKAYGESDPALTFTYSGLVPGEDASVIDTPPTCAVIVPHVNVGMYPITCSGGADNNYAFAYVDGTLTVERASTTTTVTSSLNPSSHTQLVTFTALIASSAGTPGGRVTFYDGKTPLCPDVKLTDGQAACTTGSLNPGKHSIKVVYTQTANYLTSTGSLPQKVKSTADVAITQTAIYNGSEAAVKFILTVVNNGPGPANKVVVTDTLPPRTLFVIVQPSTGICTGRAVVKCKLGQLAAGQSVTVLIKGKIRSAAFDNTAEVAASTYDPNLSNNSAVIHLNPTN